MMFVAAEPLDTLLRALVLSSIAVAWVILVVRIVGLRAFSKMTAFDFVVTVAIGSLLAGASQAESWRAFLQSCMVMSSLLGLQYLVARSRRASGRFDAIIQNSPVLLMRDGEIRHPSNAESRGKRHRPGQLAPRLRGLER